MIKDYDAITSEDSFDPRTIVIPEADGGNSRLHARETRLFLDIRGDVGADAKELQMYVEGDFYGSSSVFRLRHAYGRYGGLLAGQTWTNFLDPDNFPNTIDFESPMAFPSFRQAQVRFTAKLNDQTSWAVSVEDNNSQIENPDVPGKAEYPNPDLTTSIRFGGSRGHGYASVFLGKGRYRPTDGDPDNVTLWGSLLSGRLKTYKSDYVYGQFTFGDGVGRYRGGITAVPDCDRRVEGRRAHRVHGRLRALLVVESHVQLRVERGTDRGPRLLRGHVQQGTPLLGDQLHLLVRAEPRVGRRRVSIRQAAKSSAVMTHRQVGFSSPSASTSRSHDGRASRIECPRVSQAAGRDGDAFLVSRRLIGVSDGQFFSPCTADRPFLFGGRRASRPLA